MRGRFNRLIELHDKWCGELLPYMVLLMIAGIICAVVISPVLGTLALQVVVAWTWWSAGVQAGIGLERRAEQERNE